MGVLQSLTANQMYRQHMRERVTGEDVVGFLLQNGLHPRGVIRCLTAVSSSLENLPNAERTQRAVGSATKKAWEPDLAKSTSDELHEFIDELQISFSAIHEGIAETWFLP